MGCKRRVRVLLVLLFCFMLTTSPMTVAIAKIIVDSTTPSSTTVPVETTPITGQSTISVHSVTPTTTELKGTTTLSTSIVSLLTTNVTGAETLFMTTILPSTAEVMGISTVSVITIAPSLTNISGITTDPIMPSIEEVTLFTEAVSLSTAIVKPIVGIYTTELSIQVVSPSTSSANPIVGTLSISAFETPILPSSQTATPITGTINVVATMHFVSSDTFTVIPIAGVTTVRRSTSYLGPPPSFEKSSRESFLIESVLTEETVLTNGSVTGDLSGTLNFTHLDFVSMNTGPFAGKGFSKGEWEAILEGVRYDGSWEGAMILDSAERKIHLKGAMSGNISGTLEGYLVETMPQSGTYDQYRATWKIGTATTSAIVNINGNLNYLNVSEFPATELYVLQTSVEGTVSGGYNQNLSAVFTHLRIVSGAPYIGEGFSIVSYTCKLGSGEGWTYDRLVSPVTLVMKGLFTSPLFGIVSAVLDETETPRRLFIEIKRVDLGLPPTPNLKLKIWGPERVSPGQKIAYAIEIRNDGLKSANNVTVVNEFPWAVDYLSNTGNGIYTAYFREVSWRLDVPPKGKVDLATQGRVIWGLADGTLVASFVDAPEIRYVETDPTMGTEFEIVQVNATYSKVKAIIHNQTESSITLWETSIVKVSEMREPTVEVKDLPDDKREILYKFFIFDPSPGTYDELTIKMVENIGAVDKLLGFANRLPGYVDKTAEFELDQDWANNLYQNGKIDEETWRKLQYIGTGEYLLQTIGKELAAFSPISGKSVSSMTWDEPIARFVQHYRMTTIALYDLDLYLDLYDGVHKSRITVARDPNVKYGYDGYVLQGQTLNYTVEYENEGEGIAFGVYITETLDENLNDSTLEIGPVINKANGSVIAGPGTYNPAIRTITWLVGEVGPGEGGFVNFTIKVKNDAPEGTEVINSATVYFPSVPETTRTNTVISVVGHPSIAITDLTPLETVIARGSILYLNLTIANEGYLAETFNVTIYANSTIIRTENITMSGRSENSLLFLWNTTDFAIGNYNISAYAWPVPGETHIADNAYTAGIVIVTFPGDVNGDRKVDATDLVDLNKAYGSTFGSLAWDSNCDVNGDNKVDVLDLFILSKNYGKTDPQSSFTLNNQKKVFQGLIDNAKLGSLFVLFMFCATMPYTKTRIVRSCRCWSRIARRLLSTGSAWRGLLLEEYRRRLKSGLREWL